MTPTRRLAQGCERVGRAGIKLPPKTVTPELIILAEVGTKANDDGHLTDILDQAQANAEVVWVQVAVFLLGAAVVDAGTQSVANAAGGTEESDFYIAANRERE